MSQRRNGRSICLVPAHLGEDDDLVDAQRARLGDVLQQPVAPAQAVDAGHGGDGQVLLPVVHEDGQDQVRGRDVGLADGLPEGAAAAVAPRPRRQVLSRISRGVGMSCSDRRAAD